MKMKPRMFACFVIFLVLPVIPGGVLLPEAHAQGAITETVRRRDLVIDLGDGLKTDAQLTLPRGSPHPRLG